MVSHCQIHSNHWTFIHPSIHHHSFIHPPIHPLSTTHSFIHPSTHPPKSSTYYPFAHSFLYPLNYQSIHPFIHPSIYTSKSSTYLPLHSFTCLFTHIHPSIPSNPPTYPSISFYHLCIYPSIHSHPIPPSSPPFNSTNFSNLTQFLVLTSTPPASPSPPPS